MKIMVTGAAGFIGSHLCDKLLSDGYEVIGIDDFSYGKNENLSDAILSPRFFFVEGDIRDEHLMRQIATDGQIGVIFHLAAYPFVERNKSEIEEVRTRNIVATKNVLAEMARWKCKKIIFTSSSAVFGEKKGKIRENAWRAPISEYGGTKSECEKMIVEFCKKNDFSGSIVT